MITEFRSLFKRRVVRVKYREEDVERRSRVRRAGVIFRCSISGVRYSRFDATVSEAADCP